MDEIAMFLSVLISGFSLLLFIVSIVAYKRLRAIKLLFIGIAFFIFLIKGVLLSLEFITQDIYAIIIDFIILILLYLATAKK